MQTRLLATTVLTLAGAVAAIVVAVAILKAATMGRPKAVSAQTKRASDPLLQLVPATFDYVAVFEGDNAVYPYVLDQLVPQMFEDRALGAFLKEHPAVPAADRRLDKRVPARRIPRGQRPLRGRGVRAGQEPPETPAGAGGRGRLVPANRAGSARGSRCVRRTAKHASGTTKHRQQAARRRGAGTARRGRVAVAGAGRGAEQQPARSVARQYRKAPRGERNRSMAGPAASGRSRVRVQDARRAGDRRDDRTESRQSPAASSS